MECAARPCRTLLSRVELLCAGVGVVLLCAVGAVGVSAGFAGRRRRGRNGGSGSCMDASVANLKAIELPCGCRRHMSAEKQGVGPGWERRIR